MVRDCLERALEGDHNLRALLPLLKLEDAYRVTARIPWAGGTRRLLGVARPNAAVALDPDEVFGFRSSRRAATALEAQPDRPRPERPAGAAAAGVLHGGGSGAPDAYGTRGRLHISAAADHEVHRDLIHRFGNVCTAVAAGKITDCSSRLLPSAKGRRKIAIDPEETYACPTCWLRS